MSNYLMAEEWLCSQTQEDERKKVQQPDGNELPYYWGAFILVGG
jgi:hypothetical protein